MTASRELLEQLDAWSKLFLLQKRLNHSSPRSANRFNDHLEELILKLLPILYYRLDRKDADYFGEKILSEMDIHMVTTALFQMFVADST